MKKLIAAIAISTLAALPVGATPTFREVIAYDEMMVLTPGLEFLGYSRISTVEACEDETKTDHTALLTDSDFENFEACLISYE